MSTLPGDDAWRDAGLAEVEPDGVVELAAEPHLLEELDVRPDVAVVPLDDEYTPDEPRPDLRGEADPADVSEQAIELGTDDREDYP
ncbi:MAG: hypothetical protein ACOH2F_06600 [Cellulomonas sp.]